MVHFLENNYNFKLLKNGRTENMVKNRYYTVLKKRQEMFSPNASPAKKL